MSNSPPVKTPTTTDSGQEIISMSLPGESAYRLFSKEVFDPTSISNVDGYDEKYLEPTRGTLREIPDLIYKELKIMFFEDSAAQIRMCSKFKIGWRVDHCMTTINTTYLSKPLNNAYHLDNWTNKEVMVYFEHSDLSHHVSTHVEHLVEFKESKGFKSSYPGEPIPKDETPGDIRSWREHGYHMSHLFRALYLVVDKQSLPENTGISHELPGLEGYDRIHKLDHLVEKEVERCTILLVKTGDDAHISSPISFLPLFEGGLAMNVDRDDYTGGPEDEETAVRVKLDVAVRFIWDLLQREKDFFDELEKRDQVLEEEQDTRFQAWLEDVVSHCEEVGMDHNLFMWFASRRALARANGEALDEEQVYPVWERLRNWDL
ncbi:hypothetical protein FCIRC_10497 [Fusarium circinatum]|uniref:Uncharacterized protein n=1 Tax=Fusarium circinatum TaxID=48490 RepID=A0A8H5WNW3_FUSCI|nr:hypothetical protein FCIRC_10497 [Fusarium circinatum]